MILIKPISISVPADLENEFHGFREHFDLKKVIGYYKDGRLADWLECWSFDDEAEAVKKLSVQEENLAEQLCHILGVTSDIQEYSAINVEDVAQNSERLSKLLQYTNDPAILNHAPWVVFNQNDLENLLHAEQLPDIIYLCSNTYQFSIEMLNKKNIHYIGVGKKVKAIILSKHPIVFESLGISFDNVRFDEAYEKLQENMADKWAEYGYYLYQNEKKQEAFPWFLKAANAGNIDSMTYIGYFYLEGDVVEKNTALGMEWLEKAALSGAGDAMCGLAEQYMKGEVVAQDYEKSLSWYNKAADVGEMEAMLELGKIYTNGIGVEQDYETALDWYLKVVDVVSEDNYAEDKESIAFAMFKIGWLYEINKGTDLDWYRAADWYCRAMKAGLEDAKRGICRLVLAEFAYKLHKIKKFTPSSSFSMKDVYFKYISSFLGYMSNKDSLYHFPTPQKMILERSETVVCCLDSINSFFCEIYGVIFTEKSLIIQIKDYKTYTYHYDDIRSIKSVSSQKLAIETDEGTSTFDMDDWPLQGILIFLKVAARLDNLDSEEQSIVQSIPIGVLHGRNLLNIIAKFPNNPANREIGINGIDAFSNESFLL